MLFYDFFWLCSNLQMTNVVQEFLLHGFEPVTFSIIRQHVKHSNVLTELAVDVFEPSPVKIVKYLRLTMCTRLSIRLRLNYAI